MIKKNIGPDIIIFLSNIIKTDKIFFNEGIIAQFSEHSDSMSISYGTDPLLSGIGLVEFGVSMKSPILILI